MSQVELWVNGQLLDSLSSRPFNFAVGPVPLGPLALEVRAWDAAGNRRSAAVDVVVVEGAPAGAHESSGCHVGGDVSDAAAGLGWGLLAALLLLVLGRRRA